jgi:putative hydrolase of the HAD superfamily
VTESHPKLFRPHTVTFDCWSTLLFHAASSEAKSSRAEELAQLLGTDLELTRIALRDAWRRHQLEWHQRRVVGAHDMVELALEALDCDSTPARVTEIVLALEPSILELDVRPVPGARAALEALAAAGVRRALICDTGFSSGRVVRQLLDRQGLLEWLEVTIFSEEVGVPKPHPGAFEAALEGLGVEKEGAVHVGDLKRSDIAGAKAFGMGSVRLTAHHDDSGNGSGAGVIDCVTAGCTPPCERPEADGVAASYPELLRLLGITTSH